ncbi:MAG: hypothetical protein GC181_16170 [Bacteroidetes bacterium]|nr:hypothetical protein [Bacteroidota bacterium]
MKKKLPDFWKNIFMVSGILWFPASILILISRSSINEAGIAIMTILPVAYAIIQHYDFGFGSKKSTENPEEIQASEAD